MKLLIFGFGFTSQAFSQTLPRDWQIRATTRSREKAAMMTAPNLTARIFPGDDLTEDLNWASHVLVSAGPQNGADPVLAELREAILRAKHLEWLGYLSTTGVYGDHAGGWVTEETPLTPATKRGLARKKAEAEWMDLHREFGLPVHIFRLAGIYGPGRGPFAKLRSGKARRIIKPGQVFSRIHVDDIAATLLASINAPRPGAIYNVCDDEPAPPQDVMAYAAELLGVPIPPEIPFEEAEFTEMARSFYAESKRVDNSRIKTELSVQLRYPGYKSGLRQLLLAETAK